VTNGCPLLRGICVFEKRSLSLRISLPGVALTAAVGDVADLQEMMRDVHAGTGACMLGDTGAQLWWSRVPSVRIYGDGQLARVTVIITSSLFHDGGCVNQQSVYAG
jgi:hypothetical protein